jgi:hypothetical protein
MVDVGRATSLEQEENGCGRWPSQVAVSQPGTSGVRPLQRPRGIGTRIGAPLSGAGGAAIAHGVKPAALWSQKQHSLFTR